MVYSFLRVIARWIVLIINGRPTYRHQDRLPDGAYILVGPHRTWFDPIYYALGTPRKFAFMAKEELFTNPILRWILLHVNAFPVNRDNPGPSAIKVPVRILKKGELSLIIFPSGSRHSQDLKGGAVMIAKLAQVPIIPTVYQGPLSVRRLWSRKPVTVAFGNPITVDRRQKLDDEALAVVEKQMQSAFDHLDAEIDPNFHYVDVSKPKS